MPSQKNIEEVVKIKEDFAQAKSIVVADYSGLDSAAQVKLRAKLSEAGGRLKVTKNKLFQIVAEETIGGESEELTKALNGQNAFLYSIEDAVSSLKAIFEFAKENEKLEIKVGILDGKVLDYTATENLSKLPSKPELIGQLIARLKSPASGLVNVIQGPGRGLVYALNAIKEQKQN